MREYGKVIPQFWTGATGRQIRSSGGDAQRVALYLLTGPSAHESGLYSLALPLVAHHVGIPIKGALKALRCLERLGFAFYDETSEHVWVPEMARFQIGESLKEGDKRIRGIVSSVMAMRSSPFLSRFVSKYRERFLLETAPRWLDLVRAMEGASEPHRSQEKEQEKEQDLGEEEKEKKGGARSWKFVPPDETLTESRRADAIRIGVGDPVATWEAFVDWEFREARTNVDSTWRNWCRKAVKDGSLPPRSTRPYNPKTAGNVAAGLAFVESIKRGGTT